MANVKNKLKYDNFMKKASVVDYSKKLTKLQSEFKLSDAQWDILRRYLYHAYCKPTIQVYCLGYEIPHIKKNKQKAKDIYLNAKEFIDENRILLNNEIKD